MEGLMIWVGNDMTLKQNLKGMVNSCFNFAFRWICYDLSSSWKHGPQQVWSNLKLFSSALLNPSCTAEYNMICIWEVHIPGHLPNHIIIFSEDYKACNLIKNTSCLVWANSLFVNHSFISESAYVSFYGC